MSDLIEIIDSIIKLIAIQTNRIDFGLNINTPYLIYLFIFFGISAFFSYLLKVFHPILKIIPFFVLLYLFVFILDNFSDNYLVGAVCLGVALIFKDNIKQFFYYLKYKFFQTGDSILDFFSNIFSALKFLYIKISDSFTWTYNFLAKTFKINRRFYYFHEEVPKKKKKSSYGQKTHKKKSTIRKGGWTDTKRKVIKSLKYIFKTSKTPQEFSEKLFKNNLKLEARGKTIRFIELNTGHPYSLKSLGLEKEFNLMSSLFNNDSFVGNKKTKTAFKKEEEKLNRIKEEIRRMREEKERREKEEEEQQQQQQNNSSPPPMDNRTPREILGIISNSPTKAELKKAYTQMAFKCHPDKVQHLSPNLQQQAHEEFIKIKEAYDKLLMIAV